MRRRCPKGGALFLRRKAASRTFPPEYIIAPALDDLEEYRPNTREMPYSVAIEPDVPSSAISLRTADQLVAAELDRVLVSVLRVVHGNLGFTRAQIRPIAAGFSAPNDA